MSKKTTISKVATPATGTGPQDDAAAAILAAASTPSGKNGPDGTNTASESGDAAGSAPAGPVKPLGEEPTEGTVPEAATPSMPGIPPEAEASASGINSAAPSQGEENGGAGAAAGATGLSQAEAEAIFSKVLGVNLPEKREILVRSAYRLGGKRHAGGWQPLTREAFDVLDEAGLVSMPWDAASVIEE